MKSSIDSIEYASLLYDFYGELLDDSKREVMDLYHEDNLSLAEIAEEQGLSRQAVHYSLKKAESKLETYEEKLGLVEKFLEQSRKAEALKGTIDGLMNNPELGDEVKHDIGKLVALIDELTE